MNKKGFTLIEVIAVIIIIGVIMLIAIPSVSSIIMSSRKKTYIVDANRYIEGAKNFINTNDINLRDGNTTFYIPKKCLDMDKSQESPFGEWKDVYVVVTYDGYKYQYYYASTDTKGMGITLTHSSELKNSSIKTNIESISTKVGVGLREYIVVFEDDCKLDTVINSSITPESSIEGVETPSEDGEISSGVNLNITNLNYYPQEWTNNHVTITGKAKDVKNGITHYCFSDLMNSSGLVCINNGNDGEWTSNTNTDKKEEITATFEVTENGTYYFYTLDGRGNISRKSIKIYNIDKQAPECVISSNKTKFVCTDNNGIVSYYIGTPMTSPSYKKIAKTLKLAKDISFGSGSYVLHTIDVAGNYSENNININSNDSNDPGVLISTTSNQAATQTLTIDLEDNIALDKYYFGTTNPVGNEVEFKNLSGSPRTLTKYETVNQGGTYYAAVKDKEGNMGSSSIIFRTINATSNNTTYGKVKPAKQIIKDNSTVIINILPEKGYRYSSNDCNGTVVGNVLTISNNKKNVNCKITFVPDTYTVKVSSTNTSSGTVSPASQTVTRGDNAVITLSPKPGYGFESSTCGGKVIGNELTISNVTSPITCTVSFAGNTFLVSATTNNESYGTVSPEQQYIVKGNNASFALNPSPGYSYKSNDCGGTVSNNVLTVKSITAVKQCIVVFDVGKYTVSATSANTSFGTVTPASQNVDYNGTALINVNPKLGYKYKSNTCGASFDESNILKLENVTENKNCSVSFELVEYTVNLSVEKTTDNHTNGSVSPASKQVKHGNAAKFTLIPDTGYYYISDDCGGSVNDSGNELTIPNVTENMDCKVLFGKRPKIVKAVANNANYGKVTPAEQRTPIGENAIIIIEPKDTYKYASNNCGATLRNEHELEIANVQDNITCTITFEKIRNTLTYNSNGGSDCSPKTVDMGTPWGTLCTPTKTGYSLNRWYKDGGETVSASTIANGNLSVTAEWKAKTYKISFNANGGSGGQSADVTATYAANMPPISTTKPTRSGYKFLGWYDTSAATGGTQYYTAAGASARTWNKTNGATLYARWESTCSTFANDPWSTIATCVRSGYTGYHLGDTRTVSVGGFGNHTLRVVNTSTPGSCSNSNYSQTACGFVLEFVDVVTNTQMNNTNSNYGGWPAMPVRSYINGTIYNSLPEDLRNVIINTRVISGHGLNNSSNFTSTDKLYLLSCVEVWGTYTYDSLTTSQTRQLEYYKDVAQVTQSTIVRAKKPNSNHWWLRSTGYNAGNDGQGFYIIPPNNSPWFYYMAYETAGIAPAFRIG